MSQFKAHHIIEKPNKKTKGLLKVNILEKADDEFYIKKNDKDIRAYWWIGSLLIASAIYIGYPFNTINFSDGSMFLVLLPLIPGLFLTIYGLFGSKEDQKIILDRQNGIITYPDTFFRKPLTGQFKDLNVIFSVTGGDGYSTSEDLKFINTFSPRFIAGNKTIAFGNPEKEWSFFVWYMDSNRPLPPGNAFDPYRQQDYERRKALGFPRPLYPSDVPTPEATSAQQQEREQIAGW